MAGEPNNFLALSDRLWTSGMPTAEQLKDMAAAGVDVVINLATFEAGRDLADEQGLVRALGMEYIPIPVEWDSPHRTELEQFMRAMEAHLQQKLLVHCRANYRVSAFVALYRLQRLGWTPAQAFLDLRKIWDPDEYPIWKRFIEENMTGPR